MAADCYRYRWLDLLNSIPDHCDQCRDARGNPAPFIRKHEDRWEVAKEYACGCETGRSKTNEDEWTRAILAPWCIAKWEAREWSRSNG